MQALVDAARGQDPARGALRGESYLITQLRRRNHSARQRPRSVSGLPVGFKAPRPPHTLCPWGCRPELPGSIGDMGVGRALGTEGWRERSGCLGQVWLGLPGLYLGARGYPAWLPWRPGRSVPLPSSLALQPRRRAGEAPPIGAPRSNVGSRGKYGG